LFDFAEKNNGIFVLAPIDLQTITTRNARHERKKMTTRTTNLIKIEIPEISTTSNPSRIITATVEMTNSNPTKEVITTIKGGMKEEMKEEMTIKEEDKKTHTLTKNESPMHVIQLHRPLNVKDTTTIDFPMKDVTKGLSMPALLN
jgi:hypothetical protein